ncbi:MAG: 5'-nucleotidase C-terminal domain-containing protein [Actinomycetales bacterium]
MPLASSVRRRPMRRVLALTALALAAPLVTAAPAQAADPVTLNILATNDFHGRIDANTVAWAGTIEQLRAENPGEPNLLVGAGDLIGASLFASAVDNDQPTIDVMNAVGLDASAVGNHEFDKGWNDLRDRVIGPAGTPNAQWAYLGANVYATGTTDPVLPEYEIFDLSGVSVAVVGAVTQETASLVSPGGITDIDFGDPVEAVNRVAGELSDGDPGNGEAEVIVATFHAGAQVGEGSTFDAEVAKGGEFAEMVNLDPAVSVIINGHTHQAYSWDAPIPGSTATRPIIQTGSYGSNIGQIQLTVDPDTGQVSTYTARNVARTSTPDTDLIATFPQLAQVQTTVEAALNDAAEVGNTPVGQLDADITRALSNGEWVNDRWVAPSPVVEDRGAASSLGGLVANALRDGVPDELGTVHLGIVNPGGLRQDLLYAGDSAQNPANTDGVITYAEANAVLPFVNNIWLVDLTGAQLTQVLEQQWQRQIKPTDPMPSRPFLALGLSDNVRVTLDPTQPMDHHVTGVQINGQPLDPEKVYTVSTFSFLGTGGDNFAAFTAGTSRDTGLVDRDLWIQYLTDHQPVSPSFARTQVFQSGMPTSVAPGQQVAFSLTADTYGHTLDLTSQNAVRNTAVEAQLRSGADLTDLGSTPVADGTAVVSFTVPQAAVAGDDILLVVKTSGTRLRIPVAELADTLGAGQQLTAGLSLTSGGYTLAMQADGNLVQYAEAGRVLWSSGTEGNPGAFAVMQADGNLVVYGPAGALFSTGTGGAAGAGVTLQADGNLVVYSATGSPLWATGVDEPTPETSDRLTAGSWLRPGDELVSQDGQHRVVMQTDGNLVQYGPAGARWWSGTAGASADGAVVQSDGNLVVYSTTGTALWASRTTSGQLLVIQDDGNLVLYSATGPVWSTGIA